MAIDYLAVAQQGVVNRLSNTTPLRSRSIIFAWLVCSLGAFYYCYEYFLRISPSVMMPELMKTYHLSGAEVGSLSAFYYHAYVPMQIIVGLLMDRYSPRKLLTLASFLCAIGTLLFASGENITLAEGGRFLVGLGSAFAFVGALKLATIWLPPNRFALVSGIIMCLGMIGAMVGDILSGAMIAAIGWKATLYASAAIGVLLAMVLWSVVRDSNPHYVQPDFDPTTDHHTAFVGLWRAVRNPQLWLNGFVGFVLYISLSAFAELWGIPYLVQAHHLSSTDAANANSMIFLGWAVGGPFWGWFSDYIGRRRMPIIVGSIGALVLICVMLYSSIVSRSFIYGLLFAFGLLSSVQILVFSICREVNSIKITGTAIALTNMIVMIGGNIFQPVIGKILDMGWDGTMVDGARVYSANDYQFALTVLPISLILAIVVSFFIRETHCRHISPELSGYRPRSFQKT